MKYYFHQYIHKVLYIYIHFKFDLFASNGKITTLLFMFHDFI